MGRSFNIAVAGERRLNVLLTRAKHRLEVFCSFDPQMLEVGEASPQGMRVLHDYFRCAADGTWATGALMGREPDSDFEVAVAQALRARGLEVRAQVGVAGYRIDLAAVHPRAPGSYLLGIECDGATSRSACSARDRDRLRQRVLEGRGHPPDKQEKAVETVMRQADLLAAEWAEAA